jgi:hypothetical protein
MSAAIDLTTALDAAGDAARVLSGCDMTAEAAIAARLPSLFLGAADLPSDRQRAPEDACDTISFGWAFDAEPALLGDVASEVPNEGGCP